MNRRAGGFTLIELMVAVAIVAILAVIAVPSFQTMIQKNRLRNAVEEVYGIIAEARSEAVLRSRDTMLDVVDDASWCLGYREDNVAGTAVNCDCAITDLTNANVCSVRVANAVNGVLKRVDSADFAGVSLTWSNGASDNPRFDSVRGTAGNVGTLTLASGDWAANVIIAPIGRIQVCTPSGEGSLGYEDCP